MRDPLYREILEGLEGPLDRDVFEECVVDLLRDAFPTLVPIHGGRDAGMDGAIADGEGEPYPLIVTTDRSPIRNLTKSLDSYRDHKGERARSRIVFATSRGLTPTQRRNLEDRAQEKGFTLVQIFERRGLANRLYRDPGWRKQLLGLTGEPPALSAVPRTRRPLIELEPAGREADLEWLRTTHGDRLLYGEPGSGKTFLLLQLVREGRALFLASEDGAETADAIREQEPEIIIVDDAHVDPDRLVRLRQVRQNIRADFDILATCWLGEKDQVAEALGGLAGEDMHRLELLTRKEILEVLKQAGVHAQSEYMRDLVDQSANKPGLAVTLASLWLRGDWHEVLTGQALRRSLIGSLQRVLGGEDPTLLLASFALGGDRGMTLDLVAEATGWSRAQVWDLAVRKIAASGVLAPRGEGILAVEPRVLRYALLKEVFFSSLPTPFNHREALDKAPSTASGVETLVLAAQRGVEVPPRELQDWVRKSGIQTSWEVLASFDQDAALWVLKHYPGPVEGVARAALHHAQEATIRQLLKRSETATGRQNNTPNHPMRIVKEWVQGIPKQADLVKETLRRRQALLDGIQRYLRKDGMEAIAQEAFFAAFSPALESISPTPIGSGVTIRWGLLPDSAIDGLMKLWEQNREQMPLLTDESWPHLAETLWQWIEPREGKGEISEARQEGFQDVARRMLRDLAPAAEGSPGFTSAFLQFAERLDLDLSLVPDQAFEVLFPERSQYLKRAGSEEEPQKEELQALADDWRKRDPQEVAADLRFYEDEAAKIDGRWPRRTLTLCRTLAESVERPDQWLEASLEHNLPADLTTLFLEKTVEMRCGGWEEQIERCLHLKDYAWSTAEMVLRMDEPPEILLSAALEVLTESVELVEWACLRGEIPIPTLRRILVHPNWHLALAAASGEWNAAPSNQARAEVQEEWRQAILRARSGDFEDRRSQRDDHWLSEILRHDSSLALEWVQSRLREPSFPLSISKRGAFAAALSALGDDHTLILIAALEALPETQSLLIGEVVENLVWSPQTYAELLRSNRLRRFHFKPLAGVIPDEPWRELARLALEAGHSPEQVAECSYYFEGTYWGHGVEHWGKWETAFAEMEKTAEGPLLEVARHGLDIARKKIEAAKQEQRQYELTGYR